MPFGLGPPYCTPTDHPENFTLGVPGRHSAHGCHVAARVTKEGGLKKVHTPIRRSLDISASGLRLRNVRSPSRRGIQTGRTGRG